MATPTATTLRRRGISDQDEHHDQISTEVPSYDIINSNKSPQPRPRSFTTRFTSIQSIFWIGFIIFVLIIVFLIYYTTYYLPSAEKTQEFLSNEIDDHQSVPFGFGNYPFDTPYELRDDQISQYSKIIAIGDLHGDLTQTQKVLQLAGIFNENNEWIAKDTILVQTGDIVDRGNESIEIYKLFFKLREEAAKHNCLVLQILGNHEMMNLGGDFRYVHANEIYKYGTMTEWKEIWSMNHKIGYFLRNTPILRIIGNTLFVHAGLRPEIADIFEDDKNITNRMNEITWKGNTLPNFSMEHYLNDYYNYLTIVGNNGPIWTREFEPRFYNMNMLRKVAAKQSKSVLDDKAEIINEYLCEQLDKTLTKMNVKRMVIGHNVQASKVPMSRCDGKLFSIDVGISCAYGCNLGAISIDLESDMVSIITP